MTIYVDESKWPYRRMIMCHMITDNEPDELHEMARKIGVSQTHYQDQGKYNHYDVCKNMRTLAIKLGAVEVTSRQLLIILQDKKALDKRSKKGDDNKYLVMPSFLRRGDD